MELGTLSVLASEHDWLARQGTITTRPAFRGDSSVPWKLVSVPACKILLQWCEEEWHSRICVVRQYEDGAYEVAVEPSYLSELKDCQLLANTDYDPTQPSEAEKNILGLWEAKRKARERWLQQVVQVISSKHSPEVQQAYRDLTRSRGWQRELDRKVLIHDISKSPAPVQRKLAQNLVFLLLNLEANHTSEDAQTLLTSTQDELLDGLESGLRIPVPQKRPGGDESQITSLFRVLLELSGGKQDLLQHNFAEEYTANENSDLYASVFGIARTNNFGEFDPVKMCRTIIKSPVFSGEEMSVQILEDWSTKMKDSLRVGFRHEYLNLPRQVLWGLGVGQVNIFYAYLTRIYDQLPPLERPENNVLLLLTWSASISSWSEQDHNRPFVVLEEWAQSQDGWEVYLQLATDFQGYQSVAQLALIMAAMLIYRRLNSDFSDDSEQPITGSYVADLDALLRGDQLGNSGRVSERMVFALARELRSLGESFEDLRTFLETILDRECPPLHVSEGFCDEYIRLRMKGLLHDSAIAELAGLRLPELRGKDDNRSDAVHPEELSIQGLNTQHTSENFMDPYSIVAVSRPGDNIDLSLSLILPGDYYTLIRVTNIQDEKASDLLDKEVGKVHDVPSIETLSDGSLEICILKSKSPTVQETIRKILPDSHVDVMYDPDEPTAEDLKAWDYDTAKELRRDWFEKRAIRIAKEGWPAAAAYYAHRLESKSTGSDHWRDGMESELIKC